MDAFELQLKVLFEACSDYADECIGRKGIEELCDVLEIQQQKNDFVKSLYSAEKFASGVISFSELKEALVKILGKSSDVQSHGGNSPAREVSPKYVFGKKKYGRRTRPDSTDCENDLVYDVEACTVTDQSAIKKRKTLNEPAFIEPDDHVSQDSEEEMLVAAWAAIASPGGRLSRDELVQVFQSVGFENGSEEAAGSVFEKLNLGDSGITLDALLTFIKNGSSLSKDTKNHDYTDSPSSMDYLDSSTGIISGNHLLELWESAGIPDGMSILHNLGYRPGEDFDLAAVTTKFNGLLQGDHDDKQLYFLRAGLTLQRAYIQSLKGVLEQVTGENDKLKADVTEANQRAQMLAQEVDEHHSRLEAATLRRVKALEQRHADRIRELTDHVKLEQEQLCHQNQMLERRLETVEAEECKSKSELSRVHAEHTQLQEENQTLLDQLSGLQTERDNLQKDVHELAAVRTKLNELEESMKDRDIIALIDRVAGLEGENRTLRDQNDELTLQIENLSSSFQGASIEKRPSPKTYLDADAAMSELVASENLNAEFGACLGGELKDESQVGQVNDENSRPCGNLNLEKYDPLCRVKLQKALSDNLKNWFDFPTPDERIPILADAVLGGDLRCDCEESKGTLETLRNNLELLKDEDKKLRLRCAELEKSIELLQSEYEKTEDYWSLKLEEERNLFDSEQRQSDEKYSELVKKILEYEDMMKEEMAVRQRLDPIEEKDGLEKQVEEMEEEYTKLLAEKDSEIIKLQKELDFQPPVVDAPCQTEFPSTEYGPESNQPRYCRRSLTFSSGDRRRNCCRVYKLQNEVKCLLDAKQVAQRDVAALIAERDYLYKQVVARRREGSCCASLNSKLLSAERQCRSLMSTLRSQQLQTSELLRNTWQQHKLEVDELRSVLAVTEGKLQQQAVQIQQQHGKLASSDMLVKDLFVENSYLVATVRKLEATHMRAEHSSQ